MYHLQQWAAVQELHRKGISIRGIARQLEMSRNTVRKLLKAKEEPHYRRSCYSSRLDPYKDQIREWRCRPYEFNGTRIFRELKARGYDGSIGPVYRYLRRIDEDTNGLISSKATVRVETPPGDQAQFDWSPYQMEIGGRIQKVYCFSMILACSRKKAILFSLKDDADAIYEAIQELLPENRYHLKETQKRIVSPDSYVSIGASKYSVPVQYVGKSVRFRIIYGFRIMIYDRKERFILSVEQADEKGTVVMDPEHYRDIASKVSTSIPQIRRDFTQFFENGKR